MGTVHRLVKSAEPLSLLDVTLRYKTNAAGELPGRELVGVVHLGGPNLVAGLLRGIAAILRSATDDDAMTAALFALDTIADQLFVADDDRGTTPYVVVPAAAERVP